MAEDTRTNVELLRAAIELLQGVTSTASDLPWFANRNNGGDFVLFDARGWPLVRPQDEDGEMSDSDARLILTLQRTIDAQLAILRNNLGGAEDIASGHSPDEPAYVEDAVSLARAILGLDAARAYPSASPTRE